MTASASSRTANRVANQAAHVAENAKRLASTLKNDTRKIDNLIVRALVYALALIPLNFFVENWYPYFQSLSVIMGPGLITQICGLTALCTVQYFEVRPFLTNSRNALYASLGAYAVDVAVCMAVWPPFESSFGGLTLFMAIRWGAVAKTISVVLGWSLWFYFRRWVAKKA